MKEHNATLERFLAEIGEQVNPDTIAEAHLFQPIKQGGTESGVAVIAAREHAQFTSGEAAAENPPAAVEFSDAAAAENAVGAAAENWARLVVYTAKYRLTLKGPERGKWEFSMQAEADAPLVAVDRVVQGVQRRSGDAEYPTKYTAEEFRVMLPSRATGGPA